MANKLSQGLYFVQRIYCTTENHYSYIYTQFLVLSTISLKPPRHMKWRVIECDSARCCWNVALSLIMLSLQNPTQRKKWSSWNLCIAFYSCSAGRNTVTKISKSINVYEQNWDMSISHRAKPWGNETSQLFHAHLPR